jgi:hypothetical protein
METLLRYSMVELQDLASSVSRLLTAYLGAMENRRHLRLDEHDRFLLQSAQEVVQDVLAGLKFLSSADLASPEAGKLSIFNWVTQTVLNKPMGTGKPLKTAKNLQTYFEVLLFILNKVTGQTRGSADAKEISLVRLFFFELGSALAQDEPPDGTRVTISMHEGLLRELRRVAQDEGVPVPKLVSDIVLSYLKSSKEPAKAARP